MTESSSLGLSFPSCTVPTTQDLLTWLPNVALPQTLWDPEEAVPTLCSLFRETGEPWSDERISKGPPALGLGGQAHTF